MTEEVEESRDKGEASQGTEDTPGDPGQWVTGAVCDLCAKYESERSNKERTDVVEMISENFPRKRGKKEYTNRDSELAPPASQ